MTEEDFIALYDELSDAIFRFSFAKTSNREKAKDITQDTFVRTWEYLSRGEKIRNPKAFMFTTARNLIIDFYRKKDTSSLDLILEKGFDPADSYDDTVAERNVDGSKAIDAIGSLEEPYRETLLLHFVEGLEPRDIAEITGETANAISVRIHRGVDKLRKIVNPQEV